MLLRRRSVGIIGLVSIILVVIAFSQAGIADSHTGIVDTEIETNYDGIEDGNQAISIVATIEAEQEIDELQIDISDSSNTFVDFESIEPSVQGEGVGITAGDSRGEYILEDLQPGQSVTIQFESYPKQLAESETEAAVIQLSAENPRTLDYTTEPVADTSSSPFLELQRTNDRLESVQGELDRLILFDTITNVGIGLGVLIGLGGIGAAIVFKRKESEWKGEAYQDAAEEVQKFQASVSFNNTSIEQECRELVSNLKRKSGGNGQVSGPTFDDTSESISDTQEVMGDTGQSSNDDEKEDIF